LEFNKNHWKKKNKALNNFISKNENISKSIDIVLDAVKSDELPKSLEEDQQPRKQMGDLLLNPGASYEIKDGDEFLLVADDSDVADECLQVTKFTDIKTDIQSPLLKYSPFRIGTIKKDSEEEVSDWKTRVIKNYESKKLNDHIVLIGTWEENSDFILKYVSILKNPKSIVILNMDKPPSSIWRNIEHVPNVYIVFGSFTNLEDLYRTGIRVASNLILFAKNDSKMVVLYRSLDGTNCFKMAELIDINNSEFLSSASFADNFSFTTAYASGNVFSSSQFDTILSQSMNEDVNVVKIVELFLLSIFSISVESISKTLDKKFSTYEEMFWELVQCNLIPIGLYREHEPNRKKRFVATNPSHETPILENDIVFVIKPNSSKSEGMME